MCLVEPFKRSLPRLAALTRPAGKIGLTSTWPWAEALASVYGVIALVASAVSTLGLDVHLMLF